MADINVGNYGEVDVPLITISNIEQLNESLVNYQLNPKPTQ